MKLTRRMRLWFCLAGASTVLLLAGVFAAAQNGGVAPAHAIMVHAEPIASFDNRDPRRRVFGALEFRGGLELTSTDKDFGGLSSLRVAADGEHFISASDRGRWFRGRIIYKDGVPSGISDVETAPMLGPDGLPLTKRGWYDTESLAKDGDTLYVGIERVEKIVRFDYGRDGLQAHGQPITVPRDFKTLSANKSLECLVAVPRNMPHAGSLLTVTERSLDASGNHRSYLLKGGNVVRFTVKRSDDFDVSDCAILPSADLLLLERRFSFARGLAIRIIRVPLASIKPDALVDGKELFKADLAYQIDNMEGLSVHQNARGEVILSLISDDNFSVLQRTLLLQFALVGE
ncbi:MAG TPA: esterase-like activity of phytase family protein [Pseudolabrys sp.]|nr:esterase-like activity of phytase family protein [Pseudolabrys sp.]HVU20749.1 esterase-like activity of phytase family protein [Rhizomicrobium sp.]